MTFKHVEEQIRHMNDPHARYSMADRFKDADTMRALLDVIKAAKAARDVKPLRYEGVESTSEWWDFCYALDKLQEQNDD